MTGSSIRLQAGDRKVVAGKDGWLFLDGDSNRVMDQHSGDLRLSDADLERWRLTLEARVARLAGLDIPYLLLIAPDAHSVYPEKLPIDSAPTRPVHQLMDCLSDSDPPVSIIYPLEELAAKKDSEPVYPKTDTHWNDLGAFVAYSRLADELEKIVPLRRISRDRVAFEGTFPLNDLGAKVDPPRREVSRSARIDPLAQARLVSDNQVENNGSLVVFRCRAAPESTCLVFADSSGPGLMIFLAEGFRRLTWAHASEVDLDFVERERPDVVVSIVTERFLVQVPDGSNALSFRDLGDSKRAQARARPRMPRWSPAIEDDSTVAEVMESQFPSVEETATLRSAAGRLLELGMNSLAIRGDDDRFVGILTLRDVLKALARGTDPEEVTIGELPRRDLTVGPDDPLEDAIAIMRHHRMGWLPVVASGRLIGSIQQGDVSQRLAAPPTE